MKVLLGGDVVLRNRAENEFFAGNKDFFHQYRSLASKHDLAVVNLEAPLTVSLNSIAKTGPALKMQPDTINFLKDVGVNLVTLANNHIFDFGETGLRDTLEIIDNSSLSYVGAGMNKEQIEKPFHFYHNDSSLIILNFAENEWSTSHGDLPGANPLSIVRNYNAIASAKKNADFVAVVVHGGHEHYPLPSPRMKELYHFFVDAGADIVINHHQHCVSGFEVYKGNPIFYGIGNLLFDHDSNKSGCWTKGIMVSLELMPNKNPVFEIIHFDQCTDDTLFKLCNEKEVSLRQEEIIRLSKIIDNDDELEKSFKKFVYQKSNQYKSYLEPVRNRYYLALSNRGYLPSLVTVRKKLLMQNVIRCESHRELLLQILEK